MGIPGAENVRLIGKGYQGPDSFGIKEFTASGASNSWHIEPRSAESFAEGNTQFNGGISMPHSTRENRLISQLSDV